MIIYIQFTLPISHSPSVILFYNVSYSTVKRRNSEILIDGRLESAMPPRDYTIYSIPSGSRIQLVLFSWCTRSPADKQHHYLKLGRF